MHESIFNLLGWLPDVVILAIAAGAFGLLGGLIAFCSHRVWFRRWVQRAPHEEKLADTVHTSLLGFAAFVLALSVTDAFSVLSKVEDSVRLEALEIARLDRELEAQGAAGEAARRALAAYVRDVAREEWPSLGRTPSALSPRVRQHLDDVWKGVRAVQHGLGEDYKNVRDDMSAYLTTIERYRASRLAAATNNIPAVFWGIIGLFGIAASFLSGRDRPSRYGTQITMIQMSAIGLVVGLIVVLNNPFRGETSVSPAIMIEALKR